MNSNVSHFLIHWAVISLALWVASHVFRGLQFKNNATLVISALVLGFVNAVVKPILFFLTLPLTLVTFGFFILVINALMIMLVAKLVSGFKLSGFWTAFFASIFIAAFSFLVELMLPSHGTILIQNPNTISI